MIATCIQFERCICDNPGLMVISSVYNSQNYQSVLGFGIKLFQEFENNRCPLASENNLRIIGSAPRNNCINCDTPLLANYNLKWYHCSKRVIQMLIKRTVLV